MTGQSTRAITETIGEYFEVKAKTPEYKAQAALLQTILNNMEIPDEFVDELVAEVFKGKLKGENYDGEYERSYGN